MEMSGRSSRILLWVEAGFGVVELVDVSATNGFKTHNVVIRVVNLQGKGGEENEGADAFLTIEAASRLGTMFA
jgi:hypothetical protein